LSAFWQCRPRPPRRGRNHPPYRVCRAHPSRLVNPAVASVRSSRCSVVRCVDARLDSHRRPPLSMPAPLAIDWLKFPRCRGCEEVFGDGRPRAAAIIDLKVAGVTNTAGQRSRQPSAGRCRRSCRTLGIRLSDRSRSGLGRRRRYDWPTMSRYAV